MPNDLRGDARVVAPDATRHFVGDDGEKGGAERDQHVGANAGWLVAQLTFEADDSAEERGDEKPTDNGGVQVVQHLGILLKGEYIVERA